MVAPQVQAKTPELGRLCEKYRVKKLFAFGSAVKDTFSDTSDVDLLIDLDQPDPIVRGEVLLELWDAFEETLNRKVDLLTPESILNPYLKSSIEESKVLLYNRSREKYLSDILRAADLMEEFILPISSFEEYCADAKTQSAVERQLGIIGEALGKFSHSFPEITLQN
ncbi:MAG: nucleotidyltransferase domain-containing protein [Bacteroidota bacterium]